ncbi:MAG: hydroxyacid dehydrogenase [Candidatus Bathyarchaeota archaeon]|nr:hydroxyacid dehydrogenase [Candidatus Bathyarchaeota archaeon]
MKLSKTPKIIVGDPVDEEFFKIMKGRAEVIKAYDVSDEEFASLLKDADVVIVRSRRRITRALIDCADCLKVIARAGVGLDNIDVDYARSKGIMVVPVAEASVEAVAELTIGFMIALSRKIPQLDSKMKNGVWCKSEGVGLELKGKTLGIIGLGRIGSRVAELAKAFGMKIVAYDPYVDREVASKMGVELMDNLSDLLRVSDYVSIHTPLTDETYRMIGEEELKIMKPTAFLVNTARGAVVDERALAKALKNGWIAGAALDVFEDEPLKNSDLIKLDNVILTPHIGGNTLEAQKSIARILAEKIVDYIESYHEV